MAKQPLDSVEVLPLMNTAAVAVELYLKCLSAELIYIEDDLTPEGSFVYSEAKRVHGLVELLGAIPEDVRCLLNDVFDADLGAGWNKDLKSVLEGFEGVFMATRYPFEHGSTFPHYNLEHLMGLADFLGPFREDPSTEDHFQLEVLNDLRLAVSLRVHSAALGRPRLAAADKVHCVNLGLRSALPGPQLGEMQAYVGDERRLLVQLLSCIRLKGLTQFRLARRLLLHQNGFGLNQVSDGFFWEL